MSAVPEYTVRVCPACGKRYVAPKGERWPSCGRCGDAQLKLAPPR